MDLDDADLIRRCTPPPGKTGVVEDGFRALYAAYAGRVRTLLYRYCNQTDINDAVQETFLKIWSGLPTRRPDASLSAWIYRIAVNTAKDQLRARKRKSWLVLPATDDELAATAAAGAPHEAAAAEGDRRDAVRLAVAALPEKLKQVVVLHSLEELDIDQVAAILQIPPGTVKSRLHQARLRLRDQLGTAYLLGR